MSIRRYPLQLVLCISLLGCTLTVSGQMKRKKAGDIDRDAPTAKETVHQETHDIKAHERQMKADRVYSDFEKIRREKKKLREYRRFGNWEDYDRGKIALKHYKKHLRDDRRRNRHMDVFD